MYTPFKIEISDEVLDSIRTKVANFPWDDCYMPADGGWNYGTNMEYLKELCEYWVKEYNWREFEAKLNSFENFKTTIDGLEMHYIMKKGSGLLLSLFFLFMVGRVLFQNLCILLNHLLIQRNLVAKLKTLIP